MPLQSELQPLWHDRPTQQTAAELLSFLQSRGTFEFPRLSSGLFSAAMGAGEEFELTGYRNVWLRDTIHVAHMHWAIGEQEVAVTAIRSLLGFYHKYAEQIEFLLLGKSDPADPMNRPHIRFHGTRLERLPEPWAHAQNDALGACIWLAATIIADKGFWPSSDEWTALCRLVATLGHLKFWQDEDSGHWEENRKLAASSVGVALAGLEKFRTLLTEPVAVTTCRTISLQPAELDKWIALGRGALGMILPWECRQKDALKSRHYDAALLFLIYPFNLLSDDRALAGVIVDDVRLHLLGPYGIRRYLGDSYWCSNYKHLLTADKRTTDYSETTETRDALLSPGGEAQWCLFDPLLSVIYGRWFATSKLPGDRAAQLWHLNRALQQLTPATSRFGQYKCPESYFSEDGQYVANDICPLLWTQAHLRLALKTLSDTSPT